MRARNNTSISIILVLGLFAFIAAFLPFAWTIIVSTIFALGISFWLDNIYIRYSPTKRKLILASILCGLILLIGTTFVAGTRLYQVTIGSDRSQILNSLQESKSKIIQRLESVRTSVEKLGIKLPSMQESALQKYWTNFVQSNFATILNRSGEYLTAITDVMLNILVFMVFLMILVRQRKKINALFSDVALWGDLRLFSIYLKAQKSSYGSIFTIFTVGLVQTIVMTIGASLAGFSELSIIFIATFFASFFPVVGTAPVGLALAAFSFLQGDPRSGILMMFFAIFVGVVDNWLKPYLVAHSGPRLNGFIALVGIIGSIMTFGLPGLFVGPFLMIFIPGLKKEASDLLRGSTQTEKKIASVENSRYEASHFS